MDKVSLGKLENVEIRNYFKHEACDFTPWLARNIGALGEAIGLDLQVEFQEPNVGPFNADLLCQIIGTDKFVVVENQFGSSNHQHLGKLLTYAAGLVLKALFWLQRHLRPSTAPFSSG
jgi:hypothetical protein